MSVTQSRTDLVAPVFLHSTSTREVFLTIEATAHITQMIPASDKRESLRSKLRKYGSVVFSAALHSSILTVMAFCVFLAPIPRDVELNTVFSTGETDAPDGLVVLDTSASSLPIEFDVSAPIPETNGEVPDLDIALAQPDLPATIESQPLPPTTTLPGTSAESPFVASSIDEAVDGVTGRIQGKLQDGDLLVVWLLDASHSVADDRQRMATQLESFLQHPTSGADSHHHLLNAVVSFGAAMKEHVAPTESRETILDSISGLPVDVSGKENVFAAIGQCVLKYRRKWRGKQLMIVVLTDESGDDVTKLENTIRICRDHGVSASVVGPSAVLGADIGLRSFTDPQSHQIHQLPIRRGPDSALPERLKLDYWFLTREPQTEFGARRGFRRTGLPSWYGSDDPNVLGHRCIAAVEVALPSWYGGRDLKGLVSGFAPYALARLTLQTGGTYIIFDRDEDRGPFRADAMREYLPDYRSIEEYLHEVHSHTLRHAVTEAVKVTQVKDVSLPPTILFGKLSESPPFGFMRDYFTPASFVSNLRKSRRQLKAQADRTTRIVEEALTHVSESGSVENGLENEYEREDSRRWRAWYDLARGRLLVTTVRLEEYRLTCDLVVESGFLNETTNHLIFVPAMEMKSSSDFRRRAEEAERLLMRCVRENPNTPWAWLAQRELDYGLGIDVRQHALTLVVMPPNRTHPLHLPRL